VLSSEAMISKFVEDNFSFIIISAVLLGLAFPVFAGFGFIVPFLIAIIVFLAGFKVDISRFFGYVTDLKFFGSRFVLIKIVAPLVAFFIISFFFQRFGAWGSHSYCNAKWPKQCRYL